MNCKCISGPQVARHIILCASQSTYPQQHMLDVMQILCSQRCAGFATNVSSDEGYICAVNCLLNRRAIIKGDSVARGPKLLSIKIMLLR